MSQRLCNGIQLEVETHGDEKHPALILIRGLGTQLIEWHPQLIRSLVSKGLFVVVFDNRDVGLSAKFDSAGVPKFKDVLSGDVKAPYNVSDMAQDVVGVMDSLNIDKAHVLGISLGGMIAQVLAAEHPARLISMLSVMSSSGRSHLPGPTEEAQKAFAEPVPETQEARIQQTAEHKVVFGSPGYPESYEERLAAAKASIDRCSYPDGVARQRLAVASQPDRTEWLKSITVPVTVIHGEDDALIPVACGRDTAELIPGARFVAVPGMGHNIPGGLVDIFVAHVTDHLQNLS